MSGVIFPPVLYVRFLCILSFQTKPEPSTSKGHIFLIIFAVFD